MDPAVRNIVRDRAGDRCEYCGLREDQSPLAPLHVEHVIPKKHGATDDSGNLALACVDCNLHKGPNVAGYDPQSGALTELFNPRRQAWADHFEYRGVFLVGRTAVGRTTVEVLRLNDDDRLDLRVVEPSAQGTLLLAVSGVIGRRSGTQERALLCYPSRLAPFTPGGTAIRAVHPPSPLYSYTLRVMSSDRSGVSSRRAQRGGISGRGDASSLPEIPPVAKRSHRDDGLRPTHPDRVSGGTAGEGEGIARSM